MSKGVSDHPLNPAALNRTGACPGLFRIVPARDGGICRIKLPLGRLSAAQARRIADVATRLGSGLVEATNRANLQIRGIHRAHADAVTDALVGAGLGPAQPEADDGRNVMVSPTAGIDAHQRLDVQPLARALLDLLAAPRHRALSPKFSVLLDGGEAVAATDHPHDVWLSAVSADVFALGLAGTPPHAATTVTTIAADRVVDTVADLLARFLAAAARDPAITRMRQLSLTLDAERVPWQRRAPAPYGHVGVHAQRQPGRVYVGAVPPLGRLSPAMLFALAALVETLGDDLRLTPWRSVLLASVPAATAASITRRLEAIGLVCDPDDPRASLIACSGAPGCSAGLADTKADARRLADALGARAPRGTIHLSGCEKSCAAPRAADWTLVATAPGTYDLFRKASDAPGRFGARVAGGLDLGAAAQHLAAPDA